MLRKIFPGFAALLLCFAPGCSRIQEPEFKRLEQFGVRSVDFEKARIGFSVTYFNPNNFTVNVKEAGADIYIDSVFMGRFEQERVVNVEKRGEFSIPFLGEVPLQKVLKLNLKNLESRAVLLQANGSARIGKAGIFITKPFQYTGRHQLDEIKP